MTAYNKTDKFGGATAAANASTTGAGTVKQMPFQATFAGADVTALKVELNALKAAMVTAGLMAAS